MDSLDTRKHMFVINPKSFRQRKDMDTVIETIRHCFKTKGESDPHIHISRFPRDAIAVIRKYAAEFLEDVTIRVYAVGGDGILFDCLNGIIGLANMELAIVPYGNMNDFVRAFGENKKEVFRDIAKQATSPVISTDVLYCGNNYALNTCTIGMEAYAVHKGLAMNERFKAAIEILPLSIGESIYEFLYFFGGILSTTNSKILNQHYQISIDEHGFSGNFSCINIANGPCYGGDKTPVPPAMPDDGYFDVMLFKSINALKFIKNGLEYMYGKYRKFPEYIQHQRAKEIIIRSEIPLMLQLDGEIFIDTNITVKIIPAAVKIVAVNNIAYEARLGQGH
jgi:YegS/Rv2252/BmrU family lipid kinase